MLRRRCLLLLTLLLAVGRLWDAPLTSSVQATERPNILWLTSEDNGPDLGCYGNSYADTPHLDQLAASGLRYLHCWSNAPVCAPARTTIISGMYPPSLGAQHMRSYVPLPAGFQLFPQYLREAGYYCTNNQKEDYNVAKPEGVWNASSRQAHWKNRQPDQPFFAVFNFTITHESQIRKRPHTAVHDPAQVELPAYHPDTPETRQDWAQYHDNITTMDALVGKKLEELKAAGLEDDTIIFYFGDHGSGMPRHKRWLYNSGLHVPLLVHFPEKYRHLAPPEYTTGGTSDRLVSFVDLAPTILSICGMEAPAEWQGRAFAGKFCTKPPFYLYGFRDRMDERQDMSRAVRTQDYLYIRNFYPHRPQGQFLSYMFETPTTQVWHQLYQAGRLNADQARFWQQKPIAELYDLRKDPQQLHNLIDHPEFADIQEELETMLVRWMLEIQDLGIIPEAEMHARKGDQSPYTAQRAGELIPDYRSLLAVALAFSALPADEIDPEKFQQESLGESDWLSAYWVCQWAIRHEETGVKKVKPFLQQCLQSPSPIVRITAAEALGQYGSAADLQAALPLLLDYADLRQHDVHTAVAAWNALDFLGEKAAPVAGKLASLPTRVDHMQPRTDSLVPRLHQRILSRFKLTPAP